MEVQVHHEISRGNSEPCLGEEEESGRSQWPCDMPVWFHLDESVLFALTGLVSEAELAASLSRLMLSMSFVSRLPLLLLCPI